MSSSSSGASRSRLPPAPGGDTRLKAAIAHNPRMLETFRALTKTFVTESGVGERERWLITLRMANRCHSDYDFGRHGGATAAPDVVALARSEATAAGRDASILELVDGLYEDNDVSDALWARLTAEWSAAELVELVALVGFYWMSASLANALGVRGATRERV